MTWRTTLLLALMAAPAARAQVSVEMQAGAAASGVLVEDVIVNVVTIRPAIGPSIGLGVRSDFGGPFHAAARIQWNRSNLERKELDVRTTVLPLTVWTGSIALGARLSPLLRVEARFGALKYAPGGETDGTLFQDEAPLAAMLGAGIVLDKRLGPRWSVGLNGAVDFHQFETQTLRTAGFLGARIVHRITVGASVRWGGAP